MKLVLDNVDIDRHALVDGTLQRLRVLSRVSFSVPAGGRLAVFGPSGSGKTSLLRLLNRLDEPAGGRVLLDGEDLRGLDAVAVRRRVGLVFQQPFLFDQTVAGNLGYPLKLMHRELPRAAAAAALGEFGLGEEVLDRRGDQLSGGQGQRVAVARALTLDPEVLALDEPTSALDAESARLLLEALRRRNAAGLTLIVVTHDRAMLEKLDCPVLAVENGQAAYLTDAGVDV
ncbi:MAG: ABC transporter ATP-binding protein [Armatimonadota bacterium]